MPPWVRLIDWFIPPEIVGGDPDGIRRARTLVLFSVLLGLWVPPFVTMYWQALPPGPRAGCSATLTIALLADVCFLLAGRRHWRVHLSGFSLIAVLLATLTSLAWFTGGHRSPSVWWYAMVPLLAITLGGRLHGAAMAIACVALYVAWWMSARLGFERPQFASDDVLGVVVVLAQVGLMSATACLGLAYEFSKDVALSALARSNADLEKARALAVAASEAKSAFLANMSHEIRTPMTAVLGFTDVLLEQSEPDSDQAATLDVIRRNGRQLVELINDILDLSKIEAGRLDVSLGRCSPSEIVAEVASLMGARAAARGLAFDVRYSTPIPGTIETDVQRLRQILINLVGNAIKFTQSGSVRLVTMLVGADENPRLEFSVVDSGIGMTQDQMNSLFEPFVQADSSTSRRYGGTGLGLAISRRFAEALGGTIACESRLGLGSTFRLTLPTGSLADVPLVRPTESAAVTRLMPEQKPEPATAAVCAGRTVLLAEDGPDNQRLIAMRLRQAGARVTVVDNGRLAVDRALDAASLGDPYDVVLMDLQMPVMDGYTAVRTLRRRGYRGFIAALTANAMQGERDRCIAAGCDDFMSKPIDARALVALVASREGKG